MTPEKNCPAIESCDLTYSDLEVEVVSEQDIFFFLNFFFPPQQAVPLQSAPCQGLDGSVQVGEVGPGRKIRTGACHALIRSASLSLPGRRRQSRRGTPGTAVLLSYSPGVANGCRGPGCSGPRRSREGPARPRPLAAPTSPVPALRKWSDGQGTEGGWEEGRRRAARPAPTGAAAVCPACPPRSPTVCRRPNLCRR